MTNSDDLSDRLKRIRRIEDYLVSNLKDSDWVDEFEPDEDEIERSSRTLSEVYHDLSLPEIHGAAVIVLLLVALDAAMSLQMQVYGLSLDIWAALCFIFPSLKGPEIIASSVEGDKNAVRVMEAQEMVSTNAGFGILIVGFSLQIVAVQSQSNEFLTNNVLSGILPSGVVYAALLAIGGVALLTLGYSRGKRLDQREMDESE